jgi:RNA polymerase sigma-70 factor (ECF subfamily)
MADLRLSPILVSFLTPLRAGDSAGPELECALQDVLAAARAAWPTVSVSIDGYLRFLARHLADAFDLVVALRSLHTGDMYFAAACLEGDPQALAIFQREYLEVASSVRVRMMFSPDILEEAAQVLRHRLFVGERGSSPKIAGYAGRGRLSTWVRAGLVRASLRAARRPKGQVDLDHTTLGALASPRDDLELDYIKRLYGPKVDEALREGFALLNPPERNVLRQYYGLGRTLDEIATFYRVHRSSASRRVSTARDALMERTREILTRRFCFPGEDLSSILRLFQSQLAEGLHTLLAAPVDATDPRSVDRASMDRAKLLEEHAHN